MTARIRDAWRRFRRRFWLSLVFDVLLILLVLFAVHSWQIRDLPIDEPAPETFLALLDGPGFQSAVTAGEAGIIYFFAPWCFYCRTSIGNLEDLVSDGKVSWATTVALDYTNRDEVQEFIDRTGITLPVLMGRLETATDWSVRAFPTYYVIDADGSISSRSVGYSTKFGMLFRYRQAQ
jgi:thiol-disulfide isomerase/thioredoxin